MKTSRIKALRILLTSLIFIALVSSCKEKYIGFGVLLWSPNENMVATGSVLSVISKSKINNSYLVRGTRGKETMELPLWRVELYDTKEAAAQAAQTIKQFKTIYAKNLKDGLLLRKEASALSARVYKMKQGQIIKIVGRSSTMKDVGSYTGYWYRVLTADGTLGYCFDHYLDVYDNSVPPEKQVHPAQVLLQKAFSKSYHPALFVTMIKNGTIVLSSFTPQTGLFPNPDNKTVTITTPLYSTTFSWEKPILIDKRSFSIGGDSLEVSVLSDTHIQVQYKHQGEKVLADYYVIDNMEDIISKEMDRRTALYESLSQKGTPYKSSAYGTINFYSSRDFTWKNNSRLIPLVIPKNSGNSGKVYFDNFVSPDLSVDADGVITFSFTPDTSGTKKTDVNFLYTLSGKKLKLTFIPRSYIQNHLVVRQTASPLILAFQAQ